MPIRDKEKNREYKRLGIAKKRQASKNVEPQFVEPLKSVEPKTDVEPSGEDLFKCAYCPEKVLMEKKYSPYFAPICSSACLNNNYVPKTAKKNRKKISPIRKTPH